jgi:hypothetical protein
MTTKIVQNSELVYSGSNVMNSPPAHVLNSIKELSEILLRIIFMWLSAQFVNMFRKITTLNSVDV